MPKAEYTVFKDQDGYWFTPTSMEKNVIANPDKYRLSTMLSKTKIAACRQALTQAKAGGATEIHLRGMGSTAAIKKEAKAVGIKPYVYFASIETDLTVRSTKLSQHSA